MPKLHLRLAAPLVLVLGIIASPARAQSASDKAAAQALFDDAQKLAVGGDWAAACPKYAESNRLDPGIGVKLYLADCYEHAGKTASAWATFGEAEEYARKVGDARASLAHQRAERLTPRLVQLVIAVPAPPTGLTVKRDDEDVGSAQWGVPVPVDPGPHTVSASAPGKAAWSTKVEAKDGGGTLRVDVPKLDDATGTPASPAPAQAIPQAAPPPGTAATPPQPEAARSDAGRTQKIAAIAAAGVGVAGVALGAAFGLVAKSKLDDSNSGHCHDGNLCDATGVQLRSDAKSDALASTIAFVVGGAGLAAGAVLWLTAPRAATTVGVSPVVTDRFAGVRVGGAF